MLNLYYFVNIPLDSIGINNETGFEGKRAIKPGLFTFARLEQFRR